LPVTVEDGAGAVVDVGCAGADDEEVELGFGFEPEAEPDTDAPGVAEAREAALISAEP